MILKSTYKLTDRYNINEVIDDMCTVTIIDLSSEKEVTIDESTSYEYDCVEVFVINNNKFIESHLDMLFAKGKEKEASMIAEVSINERLEAIEEAILELVEAM